MKPEVYTRLSRIARTAGVPLRAVLLSGWICLMYRYTGQSDMVVGTKVCHPEGKVGCGNRLEDKEPFLCFRCQCTYRAGRLAVDTSNVGIPVLVHLCILETAVYVSPQYTLSPGRIVASYKLSMKYSILQLGCREGPEERQAVGVFETTMPVRVDMGRIHTYREVWACCRLANAIQRAGVMYCCHVPKRMAYGFHAIVVGIVPAAYAPDSTGATQCACPPQRAAASGRGACHGWDGRGHWSNRSFQCRLHSPPPSPSLF